MRKSKAFKEKVFQVVKKIPKGQTLSYQEVARLAGKPRAWRAVGNILNKNKDSKIPCHRAIRTDGNVCGYSKGTKKKIALLRREGIIIKKSKIQNPLDAKRTLRRNQSEINSNDQNSKFKTV